MSFADITLDANAVFAVAGVIVGIFLGAAGIWMSDRIYIRKTISEQIRDPKTVNELALLVKPDMVFDENGAVISDRGAAALIKEHGITITKEIPDHNPKKTTNREIPGVIKIAFRQHLQSAPLLTAMYPDAVFIVPSRGAEFEWIYTIDYPMRVDDDDKNVTRTYRIEIM